MNRTIDLLIDELVSDEELRRSFLSNPRKTLQLADDWGLPLSDSEIQSLIATDRSIWDRIADALDDRLQQAA